jgi:hypothetical protein
MPMLTSKFERVIAVVRSEAAATQIAAHGAEPVIWDLSSNAPPPALSADIFVHGAGIRLARGATLLSIAAAAQKTVAISSASATADGHPDRHELLQAEQLLTRLPRLSILRPTMIYGSRRDNTVRRLNVALTKLPAVPRFTGGAMITPVLADDLAEAILEALDMDTTQPLPVAGPRPIQFGELVDELCRVAGHRRLRLSVSVPMLAAVGRATRRRFGKVSHALEMLTVDRTAPGPGEVGFSYRPTELSAGVELALSRYHTGL